MIGGMQNELQKLHQWEMEGTSGNQKIRNWMEMEDEQFHLASRWLPEQCNWGNNAKGRKFQGGTELTEYVGKVCLSHACTVSKPMLSVSGTSPFN